MTGLYKNWIAKRLSALFAELGAFLTLAQMGESDGSSVVRYKVWLAPSTPRIQSELERPPS